MKKRTYYAIAAVILFFGLGLMLDFGVSKEDHLDTYVHRIERSLHKKESEVYSFLSDSGFIFRQLRGVEHLPSPQQKADLDRLLFLTNKQYNIRLYYKDSLVYWLNNRAYLSPEQAMVLANEPENIRLLRLPNGYFELIKQKLNEDVMALAMIPIKREFSRKSDFLPNEFVTDDFPIPADVFLKESGDKFAIKSMDGKPLAWLDATGPAKDRVNLQLVFFIYLTGFIFIGVLINDLAVLLVKKYKPWVGAAFVLGSVIFVRYLTIQFGFAQHFATFQTFSTVFTDPILEGVNSLGELLINIILLVWMMVFFNREFQVKEFAHPSVAIRFGLTALNFFSVNLAMLMVCSIFKSIILDSSIVFDFENVFNLNSQSVLAMIGVVLLLLAFFLFSHRMMQAIYKVGLSKNGRLGAIAVSLLASIPVVMYGDLKLPVVYFLTAAVIYLIVFEFFVEVRVLSLQWLVGWLMLFSCLTAMLLYKYNGDKDYLRREEYAIALASYEDKQAEEGVIEIGDLLLADSTLHMWNLLTNYYEDELIPKEEARDIMDAHFGINKYLLQNYKFTLYGYYRENGEAALSEQNKTFGDMERQFMQANATSSPILRFRPEKTRDPGYLLRLDLKTSHPLTIFVMLKRSFSTPSKVYTEMLLDKKYKNLGELDNYDYGIYQNDTLVEDRNETYAKQLTDSLPPEGQMRIVKHSSTRSELLYHAPNNIAIKIGRVTGGYIKPLSLFSYVFTLLTLAIMLFGGINYFTNALPGPLNFFRTAKPSLRNQFQFWVISMVLFSFLGIGFVTVWYFQKSSNDYHKGRLDRKVTSALASVNYEIRAWHKERQREWENERRSESKGIGKDAEELAREKKREKELEKKVGPVAENEREQASEKELERRREEQPHKFRIKLEKPHEELMVGAVEELNAFSLSSLIPLVSEVHRLDVNIYNLNGDLITSSEEDIFKGGLVSSKMGAFAYLNLHSLGFERSDQDESIGNLFYTAAYLPLKDLEGNTLAYMGIPYYAQHRELRSEVTDFMSTLLNVYVFLLLIAGGLAIVIANSITKKLTELGNSLQRLRLGGNEPIVWRRKDEIGDLVEAYNRAVKKIEESSLLLAQSERDGAWREMAKQVAHEIKNPLTPMKLSIQYLLHAYQSNPDPKSIEPLLKRVSGTLVEQIESLAQIATEFSNFAKMPQAQNIQFSLNDLAASVHHLFKNERPDMDINIEMPKTDFEVYADRNHVTRVINNLFKNAIQAIPDDRKGIIKMMLYQEGDKAILKVEDNGSGIPPEIQEKVFSPNFSTKNSGTGLGLAICKSIIEGFKGDIYFETEMDKGTTFFVELPLMSVTELA
ncbi:MAG: GHKL domain-containing protein [Saprospiraceae bacterium]|nr:GHKL domain-containing protein [Saprospiraceae bacterium]MCF8250754.1 GHKL domain-containing protein [Saprospiraceae bacterium]MCF8279811.1 GHKL domain-containing protein [Bacteroidales bacterium]MCF8310484.1 GHKL domain-containing protein [Saprospiraceae bacterium]MCF8440884.1 GHKL domain-containing protein [Saprospiraceae bacterium]